MRRFVLWIALALTCTQVARAEAPVELARSEFRRGTELARDARWGEALAAFERSAAVHPDAGTRFNIGVCHRALGRYARARIAFEKALAEQGPGTELLPSVVDEIKGYLREIEGVLAVADVTLTTRARIAVDGAPLERVSGERTPTFIAGVAAAGKGSVVPARRFRLVLDPGVHVIVVSSPGFSDAIVRRTFTPGTNRAVDLELSRLPASLRIESTTSGAAVSIDGIDVGATPLAVERPSGRYKVLVRKDGYLPYEVTTDLRPGERGSVRAKLNRDDPALTERWWFWTGAGVLLAGVAVGTYYATRPEPDRPALDGGGLGWTVRAR
jgi:hypothetical protein